MRGTIYIVRSRIRNSDEFVTMERKTLPPETRKSRIKVSATKDKVGSFLEIQSPFICSRQPLWPAWPYRIVVSLCALVTLATSLNTAPVLAGATTGPPYSTSKNSVVFIWIHVFRELFNSLCYCIAYYIQLRVR